MESVKSLEYSMWIWEGDKITERLCERTGYDITIFVSANEYGSQKKLCCCFVDKYISKLKLAIWTNTSAFLSLWMGDGGNCVNMSCDIFL